MAFSNRIRLPMQLHSPQFPEERNNFRKANGQVKTLSVVIRKTYELETDYFPEKWHERLKIALGHDNISWEGERYLGEIAQDGDYNIEWIDNPLRYPTAKASCKVQVTPFNATNANCQSCEQASQLSLENDEATALYGNPLEEDTDYSIDVADNDQICCYPAIFSIVSYNTDYLTSASIDPDTGMLSIHTGTGLVTDNNVLLATYRVTCPDGNYDEAEVRANIDGSLEGCTAPTGAVASNFTDDSADIDWNDSGPGTTYYWELYVNGPGTVGPVGTPVQTGTTMDNFVDLTGLSPATQYWFQVRIICYGGGTSNWNELTFNTGSEEQSCGQYLLTNTNTGGSGFSSVSYVNCAGVSDNIIVLNQSTAYVCALEVGTGNPVDISAPSGVTVNYDSAC